MKRSFSSLQLERSSSGGVPVLRGGRRASRCRRSSGGADETSPHIIRVDLGKVRKGQIPRRGSSTDGATTQDLFEYFYGCTSGYFPLIVSKLQLDVAQQQAHTARLRELREGTNAALRSLEISLAVQPGSLSAKW